MLDKLHSLACILDLEDTEFNELAVVNEKVFQLPYKRLSQIVDGADARKAVIVLLHGNKPIVPFFAVLSSLLPLQWL